MMKTDLIEYSIWSQADSEEVVKGLNISNQVVNMLTPGSDIGDVEGYLFEVKHGAFDFMRHARPFDLLINR